MKKKRIDWRKFNFHSIFFKNFILICALQIGISGILTLSYTNRMLENTIHEIEENNNNELKRSAETIDTMIAQVRNCAYYITLNEDIWLLNVAVRNDMREDAVISVTETVKRYAKLFKYIDTASVYLERLDCSVGTGSLEQGISLKNKEWMSSYAEHKESGSRDRYTLISYGKNGKYPYYMTLLFYIYGGNGEVVGAVVIEMDIDSLSRAIGYTAKDVQQLYLIDEKGKLLYANNAKAIMNPAILPENWETICENVRNGKEIEMEDGVFVSSVKSDGGGFYIRYGVPEYYEERMGITEDYLVRSVIGMLLACVCLTMIVTFHTYRPISSIMREFENDENIPDGFLENIEERDEVQYISNMIRSAKRNHEKMEMETKNWMERLGYAQIQALQSQINPHFLYNTLDSINWRLMEKLGEENELSKMICSLADLLWLSMKRDSYLVPLEEEMRHAKLYLELLNIRYEGKIQVHWEIEEELKSSMIVRLSMQPILENAAMHGLKAKRYSGDIYIKAKSAGNLMVLRIEDNGKGMTDEECMKLNHQLASDYQMVEKHVGIANVNQRIKILFGESYGILVYPRQQGGLAVELRFPKEIEKE